MLLCLYRGSHTRRPPLSPRTALSALSCCSAPSSQPSSCCTPRPRALRASSLRRDRPQQHAL
eukprot:4602585-Prymnesium_polylepis.1